MMGIKMSELTTVLLFTDIVNGLLSKGWLMTEDNMAEKENCFLERNDRFVKVEIVDDVILTIGVDLKGDDSGIDIKEANDGSNVTE
jgi:hypothetical protein